MKIYISGICGTAMGPLALMALDAGFEVCGSDRGEGGIANELRERHIDFEIGSQNGDFLQKKYTNDGIDWFVYTSALPKNHPELIAAQRLGIKISKRDEFIAFLTKKLNLKMVAVAGTHGKTTTTAAIIWGCLQLDLPVSWLVGTTLGFAKAGYYNKNSHFLIYEADEYDRNFLHYEPELSLITTVSYDHPDIYPTREEYLAAFEQFESQSQKVIKNITTNENIRLAGEARRYDATLALEAVKFIANINKIETDEWRLTEIMSNFPGVGRRFERLCDGVYTDYAHHPEEIAATIDVALDEAKLRGLKGVVAIYEPHQNLRQHEVKNGYRNVFAGVTKLFWLPTYLTRETPKTIFAPKDFIADLSNKEIAEPAVLDNKMLLKLQHFKESGYLVLLMSAGPADTVLRNFFGEK